MTGVVKIFMFIRGNAMSGAPSVSGTSQFPKPQTVIDVTMKKIITKVWPLSITLYIWSFPITDPGCPSSLWISILRDVPAIPDWALNTQHNVPMSLWLNEKNHWAKTSGLAEISE